MSWKKKDFLFAPLGGSGEIGMNANLYHYDGVWMMVDLGINFPDDSMPGVDVVLPDLAFLDDKTADLAGLVITHGHEDHLGAVPYLWRKLRCPVYGTAFTLSLLRQKLIEHGLDPATPAGVLNMGTRPNQKTLITTLADLPNAVHDEAIKGATLFVIGRVVSLAKDLSWFGEIPQG